jgi:hypothetical protein
MESNGWTYYDRVHLPSVEWLNTLRALENSALAARAARAAWPEREIDEVSKVIKARDHHIPADSLADGIERARNDSDVVAVRFDLSQGGTDDPKDPEYMKIRSLQLTARRGSGLTLYASSPNEPEVREFLAVVVQPAERTLTSRTGWHRLYDLNKVVSHPVISGLISAGLIAAIVAIWQLFF